MGRSGKRCVCASAEPTAAAWGCHNAVSDGRPRRRGLQSVQYCTESPDGASRFAETAQPATSSESDQPRQRWCIVHGRHAQHLHLGAMSVVCSGQGQHAVAADIALNRARGHGTTVVVQVAPGLAIVRGGRERSLIVWGPRDSPTAKILLVRTMTGERPCLRVRTIPVNRRAVALWFHPPTERLHPIGRPRGAGTVRSPAQLGRLSTTHYLRGSSECLHVTTPRQRRGYTGMV